MSRFTQYRVVLAEDFFESLEEARDLALRISQAGFDTEILVGPNPIERFRAPEKERTVGVPMVDSSAVE